jgi:hypothetical protein
MGQLLYYRKEKIKMGNCSATEIFDRVIDALIGKRGCLRTGIKELILALEDDDWDCQQDSEWYDNPLVNSIFKEIHPEWFEEDEEDKRREQCLTCDLMNVCPVEDRIGTIDLDKFDHYCKKTKEMYG